MTNFRPLFDFAQSPLFALPVAPLVDAHGTRAPRARVGAADSGQTDPAQLELAHLRALAFFESPRPHSAFFFEAEKRAQIARSAKPLDTTYEIRVRPVQDGIK